MPRDQFTKFPSRIPPHFVTTIARSLMPPVDPARLPAAQLIRYLKQLAETKDAIALDPVRYFKPSPGGQYDFLSCADPTIQGLYFFAGNKAGKTTGAAILVGENASGTPLWGRDQRSVRDLLLGGRTPLRICAFCEDFSTHEETIVPTILSWVPRRLLAAKPVVYGPSGNLIGINFASGTHVYLRTYDQGYEKAEGKDYDLVWCDEPPSRDIYTAIWRGLVATKGRLIIAATLLSEVWLYDELTNPFIKTFEATMFDNTWLDAQGRANFEALLNEEERNIRIYGKPSSLTGLIYSEFKDGPPFVIPIPETKHIWNTDTEDPYPIIMGVDPHERKPLHIAWAYVTPSDGIVWFDWDLVPAGRLDEVFERIDKKEREHTSPSRLVVMDPNRGTARQMDGLSWETAFTDHGFEVLLGNDDMKHGFGHTEVRNMLATAQPQMRWMETCRGKNGPIFHMLRYSWDDHSTYKARLAFGPKEKPRQAHKDWPDIFRYVACAHLEYDALTRGYAPISLANAPKQRTNPYA